nr:MAG TPA: hypothetical protein [Caudoviricetes sp.]DAQ14941.1 MAG TPA: hypothetical protein [Caudoviricetes sp.]
MNFHMCLKAEGTVNKEEGYIYICLERLSERRSFR